VPVIVSNFNFFYHQAIDEQQFHLARVNHIEDCPYRPGGYAKTDDHDHEDMHEERTNEDYQEYSEPDSDEFESLKYKPTSGE
jgi:hypothetical protein